MNHYNEIDYSLIACVLLGLLLLALMFKLAAATLAKTAVPAGYKFISLSILGRPFLLVEISAEKRLQFLKRCMQQNDSTGFVEFMRNDLTVSAELIALHMRRWYLPRWFITFRIRQLSAATIAELFRESVELSGLPFSIVKDEPEPAAVSDDSAGDDEWDWVDGEDEKKKRPVVRQ